MGNIIDFSNIKMIELIVKYRLLVNMENNRYSNNYKNYPNTKNIEYSILPQKFAFYSNEYINAYYINKLLCTYLEQNFLLAGVFRIIKTSGYISISCIDFFTLSVSVFSTAKKYMLKILLNSCIHQPEYFTNNVIDEYFINMFGKLSITCYSIIDRDLQNSIAMKYLKNINKIETIDNSFTFNLFHDSSTLRGGQIEQDYDIGYYHTYVGFLTISIHIQLHILTPFIL